MSGPQECGPGRLNCRAPLIADTRPVLWSTPGTDPGRLSLNTMLIEIGKLEAIRAVGLPVGLLMAPSIGCAAAGSSADDPAAASQAWCAPPPPGK